MRRGAQRQRQRQRQQRRQQPRRSAPPASRSTPPLAAVLDRGPVERGGDRHAERDDGAEQVARRRPRRARARTSSAMPMPATTIAAQVRAGSRWPRTSARDQRGQQRRDRHRHQHVGDGRQRDRDHEGGEHHRPAQARDPERRVAARAAVAPARRSRAASAQQDDERGGVEGAAPERHLEAASPTRAGA